MKILMLGWEYPPIISGGLGTATEGLVNALLAIGHKVTLVLPSYPYQLKTKNLQIVSPENPFISDKNLNNFQKSDNMFQIYNQTDSTLKNTYNEISEIIEKKSQHNKISHYNYNIQTKDLTKEEKEFIKIKLEEYQSYVKNITIVNKNSVIEKKIFNFTNLNYVHEKCYILGLLALNILEQDSDYQVIHAHDWMSFTAAKMIKEFYNIPIVAHIHSTEIDRAGELDNNKQIFLLEQLGLELADLVITVSEFTKNLIADKYNTPIDKIRVVYNANNDQHKIGNSAFKTENQLSKIEKTPIVTFIGRITFQKGPSYFVFAAEKVIKQNPNILFKVVGTGDLLPAMKQLTWELGIDKYFQFEGFLNASGVQKSLQSSNIFVMPSVSEPFGIVALEAIAQNIPVIISKQSGVSEVLSHALKVDFWDTELMADRILSLLKYQPIRSEMIENSIKDLNNRTWLQSAQVLLEAYKEIN